MSLILLFYKSFLFSKRWRRCVFIAALALTAACSEPGLNSDRIERRYGSYGVELLEQGADMRLSCLYSLDGERRICRTVAIVWFERPAAPELDAADRLIRAGASIGATFEQLGWQVEKSNLYVGEFRLESPALGARMGISIPATLALHAYRFRAARGDDSLNYATIVELHHPEYLERADVERLYRGLPHEPVTGEDLEALRARTRAAIAE